MQRNDGNTGVLLHDRGFWITLSLTFLYVMGIYLATLASTVTFWDAGEFISTSHILGIPHPPGTPLFVLIGRVWSLLPLPFSVPYKLNLLSALSTTVAALFLFVAVTKVLWGLVSETGDGTRKWLVYGGAFAAAVVSSTAITVWENATETEVYSISLLIIAILTWLAFRWREQRGTNAAKTTLILMAYLAGLSVGNHLMALLAGPALLVFFLVTAEGLEFRYYASVVVGLISLTLLVFAGIDLDAFGSGRFLDDPGLLAGEVIEWLPFLLFLATTILCMYWMHGLGSLKIFLFLLLFFLLGLSVHFYLPIRAALDPRINEADPITWNAFWDVLLRKQYGARPPFPRTVDFVQYQLPLYFTYFFRQYGHRVVAILFSLIGIYGAYTHARLDRKSFWYFLMVYLATSIGLVFYLNFKLGHTQALDQFPAQDLHEVRERDYFFEVSFTFFGLWVGMGLAALGLFLKELLGKRRKAATAGSLAVCLLAFVPSKLNFFESDRSNNWIAWDYAYDILISAEPYGVIFTNGDNDTFPLWFLQEVEGVRRDVMVANLSLINTTWYIQQLRDMKFPRPDELPEELVTFWRSQSVEIPDSVPPSIVSYTDPEIEALVPVQIASERVFRAGGLEVSYPKDTIFRVQDLMVLHLLKVNEWKRPIYFAVTVANENKVRLEDYFLMQGLLYRVLPLKVSELAKTDMNIGEVPEAGVYLDIARSDVLLASVYRYRGINDPSVYKDPNTRKLLNNFAAAYSFLGRAYLGKDMMDKSIWCYRLARDFAQNPERFDYLLSTLFAQKGDYARADSFLGRYMEALHGEGASDPSLYLQRAAIAFSDGDTQQAINYLEESVQADPSYEMGYRQLFRFYNALGKEEQAKDALERWHEKFPADTLVEKQLKQYENE
jgi:tetratricopeptide (TPR) repeat protein/uncharacterized membrane protein YhaH (DUF805 family)